MAIIELNEFFSHSLRVSHDNELGINAANLEGTHATYTLTWKAMEPLRLSPYLGYNHYEESYGPGAAAGLYREKFHYVAAGFNVAYDLGQRWRINLKYDYRLKDSEVEDLGYTQNRVTVMVSYQF